MKEFESERRKNQIIGDVNSLLKNKIAIKWTAPEVLESREYPCWQNHSLRPDFRTLTKDLEKILSQLHS